MRWLKQHYTGYVRVRLTGRSPERFFNLCRSSKILLWNIACEKEEYRFFLLLPDFLPDPPICKKSRGASPHPGKTGTALFFISEPEAKAVCRWGGFVFSAVVCPFPFYLEYQLIRKPSFHG